VPDMENTESLLIAIGLMVPSTLNSR
jgi:hypothetical protein